MSSEIQQKQIQAVGVADIVPRRSWKIVVISEKRLINLGGEKRAKRNPHRRAPAHVSDRAETVRTFHVRTFFQDRILFPSRTATSVALCPISRRSLHHGPVSCLSESKALGEGGLSGKPA